MDRRDFIKRAGAFSGASLSVPVFTESVSAQSAQEGDKTVDMITEDGNYYFDPIGLHIQPGDTVTFRNKSGSHSATAYKEGVGPSQTTRIPEGAEAWNTGTLTESGATSTHTFEVEGTYDYFCLPHKTLGMVGRIVVGEPGGPAEGSMPPDGEVPKSERIVEEGSISYESFTSSGSGSGSGNEVLIGSGGLGLASIAAVGVYYLVNSEGEKYRIGSDKWKKKVKDKRRGEKR